MNLQRLKSFVQFDTAGWVAISSLLLCSISGVLLAIPYDFSRSYQSLFEMLMLFPASTFIRNMHYWSAQLFFVTILLHIYDHLSKSTESNIKSRRSWLILCLVTVFLGYEMISGFILKGDAAGMQARRIVASLFESIPILGKILSSTFTGSEDNWSVVYVQHIATGTIFLFIGIFEHVRTIWPKMKTFVIVLMILVVLSLAFRAPLGIVDGSQIKGPWFFVGIQEILHWISHPGYLVFLFLVLFTLLFLLPGFRNKGKRNLKRFFLIGSLLYLFLTIMVLFFRTENWQWRHWSEKLPQDESFLIFDPVNIFIREVPISIPDKQKPEGCLICHGRMTGLSDSHNPATTGCFACHKGDPLTSDKLVAHKNMIKIPGNFSNVRQTCGTLNCHAEITDRILNSLMTSNSGIVAVDKFVFGETSTLNDSFHIQKLGHSAADIHLRNLCAGCHLGNEKINTGNAAWLERGGGCNACHLHYSDKATASMKRMQSPSGETAEEVHPSIDLQVSNDRCVSCHSRSGRISLSYEGWNETTDSGDKVGDSLHYKKLPDDRMLEFVREDVHHQKGMACIDCHGSYEIMGDRNSHIHKEDAVNLQCIDCHPLGKPNFAVIGKLPDRESQMIAGLRKYDMKNRVVVTAKGHQALLNTKVDTMGQIFLTDKIKGKSHLSKTMSQACSKGKGHDRLSCGACHTAWVPQCIGCHNLYEKETSGYDMLTGFSTKGTWVEFAGKNFAESPVLGISGKSGGKIVTAMPGMVMSIDHESFAKGEGFSFHRLYAPVSGHTTQLAGRSCKSCHNNPLAIGYGRGELRYKVAGETGSWSFEPRFAINKNDSLPEDSWIGFLKEGRSPYSTRSDLRPFTLKEQMRILAVGSCLTCHGEQSKVMDRALQDFEKTLAKCSKQCVLPMR